MSRTKAPRGAFPHLPPGREPGPQSLRSRAHRNFWSPVCAVVGAAMFAAGVFVAAGGRGPRFDREEELLGGIIFALGGVLCLFGAWVMRRRGQPRMSKQLRSIGLSAAPEEVRRGESLSVTLTGDGTTDLEVGVVCVERFDVRVPVHVRGALTYMRQTGDATLYERWERAPTGGASATVTFQVPRDAPYSYEGDCVSYAWRISARAVRRMGPDRRLDRPIWVRP